MTSYQQAGVDLEAAARHVSRIGPLVTSTWGPDVIGAFGGFAAGVRIPPGYEKPVLMMTTDGVGTKLELARRSGQWGGVGYDLVAMCIDDLAAAGARPLGLVDYMAVGCLNPERDTVIVESIAAACAKANTPLLGGETAEHPGVMEPDAVDLAAAAVGIVEEGQQLGPHRVGVGDAIVGLSSPNLRSNGFSLLRRLFADDLEDHTATFLEPSVLYSPMVMEPMATGWVNAAAHITGGGIVENLPRALPDGLGARIDTGAWEMPEVFELVASRGVSRDEMFRTFNMGIGFCLIVSPDRASDLVSQIETGRVIGEVTSSGELELT